MRDVGKERSSLRRSQSADLVGTRRAPGNRRDRSRVPSSEVVDHAARRSDHDLRSRSSRTALHGCGATRLDRQHFDRGRCEHVPANASANAAPTRGWARAQEPASNCCGVRSGQDRDRRSGGLFTVAVWAKGRRHGRSCHHRRMMEAWIGKTDYRIRRRRRLKNDGVLQSAKVSRRRF